MKQIVWFFLLSLSTSLYAWSWIDLWQTADQQGSKLLRAGKPQQAAQVFKNQNWQNVALYRAGNFEQAFRRFKNQKNSDGQYNAGNAAAYLGRYQEAIHLYDKAIALNPNNTDATINREIIKKLLKQKQKENKSSHSKDSASKNENEKKNSSEQKSVQNKESQNQADEKKIAQNNLQKNDKADANPQQQENISSISQGNHERRPFNENNKLNSKQKDDLASNSQMQTQEDQQQLLRRLSDEPGGLLRQKFLRDYIRRHSDENDIRQREGMK